MAFIKPFKRRFDRRDRNENVKNKFYWQVRRMLTNAPVTRVIHKRRSDTLLRTPNCSIVAHYSASYGG